MTRVGILGVGRLAEFLVAGLVREPGPPPLTLSPRNRERARRLAERHDLAVARDNAALVAASDLVLLATRPADAPAAADGLPWRPDHTLVSLCAGLPLAALAPHAGSAALARAMPVSAAVIGESPTALYPDLAPARAVLSRLGPVLALPDEPAFEAASVMAAAYGWLHALAAELTGWAAEAGVEPATARALTAGMMRAAAGMVAAQPDLSFEDMLEELATPGGVTALGLERLGERDALAAWREACEAVLARVRERG